MTERKELTDEYLIARFDALCMSRDTEADAIRYARDVIAADRALQGEQDALDAARYRMLRRGQLWSVIDGIGMTLRAETLDAAIDSARAAQGATE